MKKISLKDFPRNAKFGLAFQTAACLIFVSCQIAATGKISIVHLTLGFFLCIFLYSAKKAGRYLSIIYNLVMTVCLLNGIYIASADGFKLTESMITDISIITLFLAATVFISSKQTADFYNSIASRQE